MPDDRSMKVKEVARRTGLTVRTLQYYDEIELLRPGRSGAGYRDYQAADLARLQQILIQRALGFSLEEIRRALDAPDFDRKAALIKQREALVRDKERLEKMILNIDDSLGSLKEEQTMTYEKEVEERWGETPEFKTSQKRVAQYSSEQMEEIKQLGNQIEDSLLKRFLANEPVEDAVEDAERARLHIDRWFYPIDRELHARLAQMYTEDSRFEAHYEERAKGFAAYVRSAIEKNLES